MDSVGDWSQLWSDPRTFVFTERTPLASMRFSIGTALVYVACILVLKFLRQGAAPMKLDFFSKLHNFILTTWSLVMHIGIVYGAIERGLERGWFSLLCDRDPVSQRGVLGYFCWMYYLSKYYELLDTVLMVLKNKPLTVLHFWHHAVIGPMSLSWIQGNWILHWYGAAVNSGIHVLMYYYYFASSVWGSKPWYRRYITQMQIAQFFSVFALIFVFAYFYVQSPISVVPRDDSFLPALEFVRGCQGDAWTVAFAQLVNVSFLVLFINFYLHTYSADSASGPSGAARKQKAQ